MEPVTTIQGHVTVLDRADIDTDQIIPKQFLKRIERTGYGEFLFFDWVRSGEVSVARPLHLLSFEGKRAPFAGLGIDAAVLNDYVSMKHRFGPGAFGLPG